MTPCDGFKKLLLCSAGTLQTSLLPCQWLSVRPCRDGVLEGGCKAGGGEGASHELNPATFFRGGRLQQQLILISFFPHTSEPASLHPSEVAAAPASVPSSEV